MSSNSQSQSTYSNQLIIQAYQLVREMSQELAEKYRIDTSNTVPAASFEAEMQLADAGAGEGFAKFNRQ